MEDEHEDQYSEEELNLTTDMQQVENSSLVGELQQEQQAEAAEESQEEGQQHGSSEYQPYGEQDGDTSGQQQEQDASAAYSTDFADTSAALLPPSHTHSSSGQNQSVPPAPQDQPSSASLRSNGGAHTAAYSSSSQRGERGLAAFQRLATPAEMLPVERVPELLSDMDVQVTTDYEELLYTVAGGASAITLDQAMALVGIIQSATAAAASGAIPGGHGISGLASGPSASNVAPTAVPSSTSLPAAPGAVSSSDPDAPAGGGLAGSPSLAMSGLSRSPLKKVLTKSRYYMETGMLTYDDAVVSYIQKLEEHRRRCEGEGRYAEAKAAARRLADLKTAQVERLRAELVNNQRRELEEVHKVYEEETSKFLLIWQKRVKDYEANFAKAVDELRAVHKRQTEAFLAEVEAKRPRKPQNSRDYFDQRAIQDKMAKSKLYIRASKVKEMADVLYAAEMEQTITAFEVQLKLRAAKLQAKQQQEFEALLQRGTRGRDELELKCITETERRTLRFRNIVAELENLHRLEVVHLENFLDGQVQAGKAVPLKDGFRRKREQLLMTPF